MCARSGLGKLFGSMCAVAGVLVLSLPIPIIAGNFEAFHKNQQKMTKAEKGKKKLKAAKIEEMETRQLYCNNKMTSCPSTRSPGKQNIYSYLLISISISTDIYNIKTFADLASAADHLLGLGRKHGAENGIHKKNKHDTFLYC